MKNKWPERHYIDLFAGAGYARIRGTGEVVETSTVIAAKVRDAFTRLHLCEANQSKSNALRTRLRPIEGRYSIHQGDANSLVGEILSGIAERGTLCTCFVDPFGLNFHYETAKKVATKQCDLIVLLPDHMDVVRNWKDYYEDNPNSNLDSFMGEAGWRTEFAREGNQGVASRFRERYTSRLRELGYLHFD